MRGAAANIIVVAAATYVAILCAIHTSIAPVSNLMAAVDAAITLAALALALSRASPGAWLVLFLLGTNAVWLAAIAPDFDIKGAIRDPLVLIAFTLLGLTCAQFSRARWLFIAIAALVMIVALVELFAPQLYTHIFNILSFYRDRGLVSADTASQIDSSLFVSAMRPGGRVLAPLIGDHRISSIFLEPVSMGNFGALAIAFALSIPSKYWRSAAAIAAVGISAIVLSDARFALLASVLFLLARFVPVRWANIVLAPMPIVAIAILLYAARSFAPSGDDLPGRLATSGIILESLSINQLAGAAPHSISTVDAGYAYAITSLGLPFCIALWCAFAAMPTPTVHAQRYKLFLGIYACALLCVSGTSLFALKTAGLAWFVLGAMAAERYTARRALAPIQARPLAPAQ